NSRLKRGQKDCGDDHGVRCQDQTESGPALRQSRLRIFPLRLPPDSSPLGQDRATFLCRETAEKGSQFYSCPATLGNKCCRNFLEAHLLSESPSLQPPSR